MTVALPPPVVLLASQPMPITPLASHRLPCRHATRLYAPLGADLHILKLRAPLAALLADPHALLPGSVRPECGEGLRRLGALRQAQWARQADSLCLHPTSEQVRAWGRLVRDTACWKPLAGSQSLAPRKTLCPYPPAPLPASCTRSSS
jgi:hypothetical protein